MDGVESLGGVVGGSGSERTGKSMKTKLVVSRFLAVVRERERAAEWQTGQRRAVETKTQLAVFLPLLPSNFSP